MTAMRMEQGLPASACYGQAESWSHEVFLHRAMAVSDNSARREPRARRLQRSRRATRRRPLRGHRGSVQQQDSGLFRVSHRLELVIPGEFVPVELAQRGIGVLARGDVQGALEPGDGESGPVQDRVESGGDRC